MIEAVPYIPKNKIRIVTAASLFDGHDAAINIMRRIIQSTGVEVIHLGHDRSVLEVVNCAIQEDAHAIAMTSYQGGHTEYFKYMHDLLKEKGAGHIKIFGGGGGTILPSEIEELQSYGITRIYHPDDGRAMGLQGMINDMVQQCDFALGTDATVDVKQLASKDWPSIARLISVAENSPELSGKAMKKVREVSSTSKSPVLGITGTGGAGKSSLVDELVRRFLLDFPEKTLAIVSVDPSKRKTGGALLGDRIRMNAIRNPRVYMRSLATRQSNLALSKHVQEAVDILKAAQYDLIILETSGIGQSDTEILDHSNVSLYVMTPEFGAATQLEKIDMLDFADIVAINKFDKRGALDAIRDVKKQYKRNHQLWDAKDGTLPVFGTIASQFNDPGTNTLYKAIMDKVVERTGADLHSSFAISAEMSEKIYIIPPQRTRYLSEISENNRGYDKWVAQQAEVADRLYSLCQTIRLLGGPDVASSEALTAWMAARPSSPPGKEGLGEVGKTYRKSDSIRNLPELKSFRKQLRSEMTPAEVRLWQNLKSKNLGGRKFRRQHSVGPYILDFYCPSESLAIELDGEVHNTITAAHNDHERTLFLEHFGIKVLRFENRLVFELLEPVLDSIKEEFGWKDKTTSPNPSLPGGELSSAPTLDQRASSPPAKGEYPEGGRGSVHDKEGWPQAGEAMHLLITHFNQTKLDLDPKNWLLIETWPKEAQRYKDEFYIFKVRDKEIKVKTHTESLSHLQIPKVATPKFRSWGDQLRWLLQENVPGSFPYTAGIYPFKREGEDPARMFAGEGGPERTNRRFHYVSKGLPAKRLSTAFDSVTLYGHDPHLRPDIYGKVGNSGVSICCLDDAKKLYSGFDLTHPMTSVSMTINGPAPMLLGFFMNAAIDQECEKYIKENELENEVEKKKKEKFDSKSISRPAYQGNLPEGNNGLGLLLLGLTGDEVLPKDVYEKIKADALSKVRGTVQADILKEDQAQNTCIFSTEFALRLMGDVQEYFITRKVRNFYSVSISGYHIAEAGANPISQLAFTLSNGFTFVEYYLSRGMDINAFGPNLSFFFSNGIDPEYAVIGRVARRIWAKAMKQKYGADERSQMLKYHIQTSGRSLHAQEIDFNDIRTTLQALYAIYDNCNSLHTNAYDEAITTPTEESVRRAMAIQLIINKELGLAKNENPLQGAFIIEELTELVEEAVLTEFDRITERGGVLGAMETMYQRSRIQEESLYYETLKHTGEFPIIGVNTFLSSKGSPTILPKEVIRATEDEKQYQIAMLADLQKANEARSGQLLKQLQQVAVQNGNLFDTLMDVTKACSLGQITDALFEVGGQYRRNM
jgi:methylmalonyl-CoA mutase cobalamin-binding domain/chain